MTKYQFLNAGKEKGAALMIIVFILALALTTYILKSMNTQTIQVDHQQRVRARLNEAKQALIAWAVANKEYPGQMPYPDRLESINPIYDGGSDCGGNPVNNYSNLIGQLARFGSDGCLSFQLSEGLGVNVDDGYGNNFWYAVSPNLLHNYAPTSGQLADPIINSTITRNPDPANPLDLHQPWLRVLDSNGNPISDRVAAVIIAPGEALGAQSRSNTAAASNFLDTFQKNGTTYSNSDYDDINEDFIMGADVSKVNEDDTSYTRPYLFNDQLVYITIDELMVALEKRAANEAVSRLREFYNDYGYFPFASIDFTNNSCDVGRVQGLLPFQSCSGNPDALPTESPRDWLIDNEWDDLLFYAVSSDCIESSSSVPKCSAPNLIVGTQAGVAALVISSGAELPQTEAFGGTVNQVGARPSLNPNNYLDSDVNVDGDGTFDAVGMPITSTYNDQMFIVAP